MASCRPPKSVSVRDYWRGGPRRKPRPKAGATYYECERKGRGCGTHHKTMMAALKHSKTLNRVVRRQARARGERLVLWDPEKHTT